jgi:hypothetical protein
MKLQMKQIHCLSVHILIGMLVQIMLTLTHGIQNNQNSCPVHFRWRKGIVIEYDTISLGMVQEKLNFFFINTKL